MSEQPKCHKCGAESVGDHPAASVIGEWYCGSYPLKYGGIAQSDRCKLTVLERDNAALRAMLERVRPHVDTFHAPGLFGEIGKLLKETERDA